MITVLCNVILQIIHPYGTARIIQVQPHVIRVKAKLILQISVFIRNSLGNIYENKASLIAGLGCKTVILFYIPVVKPGLIVH